MRKILLVALSALILSGCTDKKAQQKALLGEVIKIHDKVMGADEQLMNNKMKLDTLLTKNNLVRKDSAVLLRAKLVAIDSMMENWMHKFNPDYKGQTEDETVKYFSDQKKQISTINFRINEAVSASNEYLFEVKAK